MGEWHLTSDLFQCPRCSRSLRSGASFCGSCGEQVGVHCPSCDVINPASDSYCYDCGERLYPPPWELFSKGGTHGPAAPPPRNEPRRYAVSTACERCGALNEPAATYCYQCGLPLDEQPAADGISSVDLLSPPQFRSPRKLGSWAIGLLALVCFLTAFRAATVNAQFDIVNDLDVALAAGQLVGSEQLDGLRTNVLSGHWLITWLYLAAAIPFLMWEYRVSRNLRAMGVISHRYASRGWPVVWWFTPILNMFMPYWVLVQIWRGSIPPHQSHQGQAPREQWVLIAWWVLFLIGMLTTEMAAEWVEHNDLVTETQLWLTLAGNSAIIGSGMALIYLIHRISRDQEEVARQRSDLG